MGYDVATDGLLGISGKHGGSVNLRYDLVSDDHCHTKLEERENTPDSHQAYDIPNFLTHRVGSVNINHTHSVA